MVGIGTNTNTTSETKHYTLEEIAKNNGVQTDKLWIIIRDQVYDVTQYLDEHPGGGDLIKEWAGKDATKEFDNFGHSSDAKNELKKFKIGEVVEEHRKHKTKKTDKDNQISKLKVPKVIEVGDNFGKRSCLSIITCGICS